MTSQWRRRRSKIAVARTWVMSAYGDGHSGAHRRSEARTATASDPHSDARGIRAAQRPVMSPRDTPVTKAPHLFWTC